MTPFYAYHGYHPLDPFSTPLSTSNIPSIQKRIENLADVREEIVVNLQHAQEQYSKFYNKKINNTPALEVDDMVFLNGKNIKTTRPAIKLDHKNLGPYRIKALTKSDMVYVLDLPDTMRLLHPAFHISLLNPKRPEHDNQVQEPQAPIIIADEPEYFVDCILNSEYRPYDEEHTYWYLVH